MKLVIQKNQLLHALQTVQRAVPTRTTKSILYGILLTAKETQLEISAYDLELAIQTTIYTTSEQEDSLLQIEEPGEIVLNARYLIDIVRKLPQSLIRIDIQGLTTIIHSGNATYTLNGMDAREYPTLPELPQKIGLTIPADILTSLIDHTVFAVSASEVRPTLTGVLLKYNDGLLEVIATDSHRVATQSVAVDALKDYERLEVIIPGKTFNELSKILPDDDTLVNIHVVQNQVMISFLQTQFYSRLIEGTYPDISRIIPSSFITSIEIDGKKFSECIERAALLAKDNDNQIVRLLLRPINIEVTSHSLEIGKITEIIEPNSYYGEDLLIGCNAKYLLEALKALGATTVKIQFTGNGSAFVLNDINNPRHLHLILPVRLGS